ncbi:helix-turn-helix transcriptional regulator [Boseongicola aestuarii]|uniref:Helix-turn-helix domain protein n=1 Tax=Boseongicola aestuarii TaxID=1470561 RepID=A0A238J345_9RHOB|nr:helix-turn-helix domain-containing protein [Boseongicola aestuarii]SMX25037.1 Helix-turn-helix domain protein [Boseongicola aestuarii]
MSNSDLIQPKFYTTKDLATYLRVSTSFLEKARMNKMGPTYIKVHGRVLYRNVDIEAWLDSNEIRTQGAQ